MPFAASSVRLRGELLLACSAQEPALTGACATKVPLFSGS